jgi:hypothetical protein
MSKPKTVTTGPTKAAALLKGTALIERPSAPPSPMKQGTTPTVIDYRSTTPVPKWISEVIEAHLAIEQEDAKSAGALGFMARAMVLATMPYKDPKKDAYTRTNGDFRLRIVAGYEGGIPYGIYPRLLMSWLTAEACANKSPVIELGDSLSQFLRDVLELRSTGGGKRGTGTRVTEQMKRLFGSLVTAQWSGDRERRGFSLKNVLIADELELTDADIQKLKRLDDPTGQDEIGAPLWKPQAEHEAGQWRSHVRLTDRFYQECVTSPVPIDLRAYKSLRGNPLAMDLYTWLTYRMISVRKRTKPIRWEALMMQFGSGYNSADPGQAVRDFRKAFHRAYKLVKIVYPKVRLDTTATGVVLFPSPPHIPPNNHLALPSPSQRALF